MSETRRRKTGGRTAHKGSGTAGRRSPAHRAPAKHGAQNNQERKHVSKAATPVARQQRTRRHARLKQRRERRFRWILNTLVGIFLSCVVIMLSVFTIVCGPAPRRSTKTAITQLSSALIASSATLPDKLYAKLLASDEAYVALEASRLLGTLTTEQKVAQLFVVTPESLLSDYTDETVTAAADLTREALQKRPVGGIVYFQSNLLNPDQTSLMLANTKQYALEACGIPIMLDVDEEGGTVSRIGNNEGFDIDDVGSMFYVGSTEDPAYAKEVAQTIGSYLHELGFNSDFAPVADVANNPDSDTMYWRSFGSDANLVAQMVSAQVEGFASQGILCCAKHFPGIGGAEGDSHEGAIYTQKSADQMAEEELVPFKAAIEAGVPMVMVGHLSCPQITGNNLPASVSSAVMQGLLRERLGFEGVIITDSLGMGAIVNEFGYDRVGVEAFLAGADALLMPADFNAAYQGMLDAVASGEISQERLNQSVYRMIKMKLFVERTEAANV